MALSRMEYPYAGTNQFVLAFALGYLSRDTLKAYVVGELDGNGDQVYRTLTFITDNLVEVSGVLENGNVIRIDRNTKRNELINNYTKRTSITNENLLQSFKQALHLSHETLDGRMATLSEPLDMGLQKITNLADGTADSDAVNKSQLDAITSTTLPVLQGLLTDATTQAGISTTNATNTGNDVISTNADVVSTNADVIATNADVITTNADVLLTNANVVSSATNASNANQSALDAQVSKMEWQNTYNAGTAYALNDVVYFDGSSYINIQAGTGEQPNTSPAYWELVALKGADGVDGVDGTGTMNSIVAGTGLSGGTITNGDTIGISSGGVTSTELANNSVTNTKLGNASISGVKLQSNAVTNAKIANTQITATKLIGTGSVAGAVLTSNGATSAPTWQEGGGDPTKEVSTLLISEQSGSTHSIWKGINISSLVDQSVGQTRINYITGYPNALSACILGSCTGGGVSLSPGSTYCLFSSYNVRSGIANTTVGGAYDSGNINFVAIGETL